MMSYYRRHLPHIQPDNSVFFVTTRLKNSIPISKIFLLRGELEKRISLIPNNLSNATKKSITNNLYLLEFLKIEKLLDENKRNRWLSNTEVADVIKNALHHFDGERYNLIAYTIMPNHIHIVFDTIVGRPSRSSNKKNINNINSRPPWSTYNKHEKSRHNNYQVSKIMESLKGFTARKCNKILGREGQFWQHESYDHVVRSENELRRIVKYLLYNPVKAQFCKTAEDYPWNYYNEKYF